MSSPVEMGRKGKLTITAEGVLYGAIALTALLMRLLQIGRVPLNLDEARNALAALHLTYAQAPGPTPVPTSPLAFAGMTLSIGILGGTDAAARLPSVIAGIGLVLAPALFRDQIGRVSALIVSALLAISPSAVMASRLADGVTFSALLTVLIVWMALGLGPEEARSAGKRAIGLGIAAGALLFLCESGGAYSALTLIGGLLFLIQTEKRGGEFGDLLRRISVRFQWPVGAGAAVVTVALVATLGFFHPGGLSAVGDLILGSVRMATTRNPVGFFAYPISVLLLYEPLLFVLGVWGVARAIWRPGRFSGFLIGWALSGFFLAALVPGAVAGHVLWVIVPLAFLAAEPLAAMGRMWESVDLRSGELPWNIPPAWGVVAHGAASLAFLLVAGANLLGFARQMPVTELGEWMQPILALLALILLVILFFLVGSIWGERGAWPGLAVGLIAFLLIYTVGAAWGVAVARGDDPRELWHMNVPAGTLHLLRETIEEASIRHTGDPHTIDMVVLAPQDWSLEWELRGFPNATFVRTLSPRVTAPVVITPVADEEPAMGTDYVGQDFVTERTWTPWFDDARQIVAWIMQRHSAREPYATRAYVLWVRGDVYGLPPEAPDQE